MIGLLPSSVEILFGIGIFHSVILLSVMFKDMKVLRDKTPIARKEHRCEFCGEVIHVGEKYNRQTNVCDDRIYDWVSHCDCTQLAYELNMFDDCDEGLDDDGFIDRLNQYVYDNHYDDKIDDIAKDWQLPRYELVRKVLDELNKK